MKLKVYKEILLLDIKARIKVAYGVDTVEWVNIKPARILFEESYILFGFKAFVPDYKCTVLALDINGYVSEFTRLVEAGDSFFPGGRFYYPQFLEQSDLRKA